MKKEPIKTNRDNNTHNHFKVYLEPDENPTIEEVLNFCHNGDRVPFEQWNSDNIKIYFSGYYNLIKTNYGYEYYGFTPYSD